MAKIMSEVLERPIRFQQVGGEAYQAVLMQYAMTGLRAWPTWRRPRIRVSTTPSRASRSPPAFASGVGKCSDQPSWPEHHPGDKRPAEQVGRHALEITALSLPLRPGSLARFAPVSET